MLFRVHILNWRSDNQAFIILSCVHTPSLVVSVSPPVTLLPPPVVDVLVLLVAVLGRPPRAHWRGNVSGGVGGRSVASPAGPGGRHCRVAGAGAGGGGGHGGVAGARAVSRGGHLCVRDPGAWGVAASTVAGPSSWNKEIDMLMKTWAALPDLEDPRKRDIMSLVFMLDIAI